MKYRIEISWHYLDGGEKYHYIHVYQGLGYIPFRRWGWVTTPDNQFIKFI